MTRSGLAETIQEQGWATVPFEMSEADRAHYAALANKVISIAQENADVDSALQFETVPPAHDGRVHTGRFGVSSATNSTDKKLWFHAGFQSRGYAASVLSESRQPAELKEFWPAHEAMLHQVKRDMSAAVLMLGAPAVRSLIFPNHISATNVHIRTVRYIDAANTAKADGGEELVSGHTDLGVCSLHLYETHGNYIAGGPYPPELINDSDTFERRAGVRHIRDTQLRPMQAGEHEAVFFLGAGWHGLPTLVKTEALSDLPACYHAGFQPTIEAGQVSPYASSVVGESDDRVSLIVFGHPNTMFMQSSEYRIPTVAHCRPEYALLPEPAE